MGGLRFSSIAFSENFSSPLCLPLVPENWIQASWVNNPAAAGECRCLQSLCWSSCCNTTFAVFL
jgi:hypothetical protein